MTLVVDASVIVDSLLGTLEPGPRALISDERIATPDLMDVEVASALRGLWLGRRIDSARMQETVTDLSRFATTRYSSHPLVPRALQLRNNLTVYDATYVALAEALECTLLTRDRRIAEVPGIRCSVEVI